MDYQYRFTIFTSCYNSAKFIHRVFESLDSQTFRDFEWLVIDDASTDSTADIIKEYVSQSVFPINFIKQPVNQMLTRNVNLAFQQAKGEFMVFAGHDDSFDADTLETFNNIWKSYGSERISGIWCLCRDQNGKSVGNEFPDQVQVSNYFDFFVKYIYRKERFGCTRIDILKRFPFDVSKSNYIPEDVLWGRIGMEYNTIYLNRVLRTYFIEVDNAAALTKSSRDRFAEGIYYSYTIWINSFLKRLKAGFLLRLRIFFAYSFYAVLNNVSFSNSMKEINRERHKIIISIVYPIAFSLAKTMKVLKNRAGPD